MKSVRCLEFRGGRFSEVANVLHKQDFQSVTATLSAVGSVFASRNVRSGRFYCISSLHKEETISYAKESHNYDTSQPSVSSTSILTNTCNRLECFWF